MPRRFKDELQRFTDFVGEQLVVCPACKKRATLHTREPESGIEARVILTCPACGSSKTDGANAAMAWLRGMEHWLVTPCCGHTLWAVNPEHLDWLERYLSAKLRERTRSSEFSWSNKSLASRLPTWMTSAISRKDVLAGIARLRSRLR